MTARIITGDCLDVMAGMEPASVDAIVTDPPYGLNFMARDWDHGVPGERYWIEALRVAKPGAHLLAFGGTRTFHRLTCAIEDAGWEIRDCLMWVYGSGFPKSKNIGGGLGTALKPAWEPIILARAPLAGTVAATVCEHGTGALNIDGCRIGGEPWTAHDATGLAKTKFFTVGETPVIHKEPHALGRWPANLIHDGSDEVIELFPKTGGGDKRGDCSGTRPGGFANIGADRGDGTPNARVYADTGSAARFFYCAKASRAERGEGNVHPTVKPLALMRYLCRLITPPGGLVLDPFAGSGSTLLTAVAEGFAAVGIEKDPTYAEIARQRFGPLDQFAEASA